MVLEFQLLGTMLINGEPARSVLPGTRAQQLLATLLQHPNRYVAFDTIADNLWDERPPKSAAANLRNHVGAVRRAIAATGLRSRVETRNGGYQIAISPQLLDTSRVDELLAEARHLVSVQQPQDALPLINEALALWRGSPFEDLPICSAWAPQIARWELLHTECLDLAVRLNLEFGDPWQAAGLVRGRLDTDPYDETAWCQLVRCCLAGGMVSQAVQSLADARQLLADDLGTEPGPELQELERQVRDDPTESGLTVVPMLTGGHERRADSPAQLPQDVADFSGRDDQLAETVALFNRRPEDRPAVLIVTGPPGVGKTAFVTHAAHQLRQAYPDGQIYLDLRGTSTPLSPAFAVTEVLAALGISNPSAELGRAAALLRSELANRRLLVVVDDAGSAEQLTPLLPGTGDSAVLVSSRRRLTEVTGAELLDLDVLSIDDAAEMVGRVAGIAEPSERLLLADACGCHPLAIRIAGGRLVRRPDLSVRALARRLSDPSRALNELTLGEIAFSSTAQLSCSTLGAAAARGFRTLGTLEVGEFSGLTVDVAAGDDGAEALLEQNLLRVDRSPDGRVSYLMHDLLRFHARRWADEIGEDVGGNVRAMLTSWLGVSGLAAAALPSSYFGPQPDLPPPDVDAGTLAEIRAAPDAWYDGERRRLDAMVASALRHDCADLASRLILAWSPYFDLRGHTSAWISGLEQVLAPTRAAGDDFGLGCILRDIGQVALYRDAPDEAADALAESLQRFVAVREWVGAGFASIGLVVADEMRGTVTDRTRRRCGEALDWFTRADHPAGIAAAHNALALVHLARGEYDRAMPVLERATAAAAASGDRHRQAQVLRRYAEVHARRGEIAAGERKLESALRIFLDLGDHRCAGYASTRLGRLKLASGDDTGARRQFREALAAGRRLADPAAQAEAWSAMAEAVQADSQAQAVGCLQRSIRAWQVADQQAKAAAVADRLAQLRASGHQVVPGLAPG
ncbi:AfsR/SARP family transcriptional regulator [Microlunatus soli]|uniref:DNA-binding transcriptional activator of the SARP family n=1 Tax=Microlunatus soli TaxID=630515 RepID=A0A1H2A736_9ACTN|nr:BTAD domain-containing putative transcriptional regulator [Microlunatus soli]SDT41791.1 DNA-binding transcriptional activator of the SARP family [Microlunatus soli]